MFGCFGENGLDMNLRKCALMILEIEKKAEFQNFVCVAAETRYFPICERICQNFQLHPSAGEGVNLHENVVFAGGMLGWWSCCFCIVSLTWL